MIIYRECHLGFVNLLKLNGILYYKYFLGQSVTAYVNLIISLLNDQLGSFLGINNEKEIKLLTCAESKALVNISI